MADPDRPRLPGSRALSDVAGALSQAFARGVDVDAVLADVDVDQLIGRADVNALLDRVDVNHLLDRVDVNRLLDRVDVNRILDRVDVDRLVDRADPDRILDRVDPDRLLDRIDVEPLVARARIAEIVAESTGQVAGTAIDSVRRQIVALDVLLMRVLYGITGRDLRSLPSGPERLVVRQDDDRSPRLDGAGAPVEMTGRYAGLLTRLLALAVDIGIATGAYSLLVALVTWIVTGVLGLDVGGSRTSGIAFVVGLGLWWALYWVGTLSLQGRTPAMGLVGLRVLARDGAPLRTGRVVVWTLALPLSLVFGVGYLLLLTSPHRQALHDRFARSVVVYDWGRSTTLRSPLATFLAEHEPPAG